MNAWTPTSRNMLVPVKLLTNLKYAAWNLPGALHIAWLQEDVHQRLLHANACIKRRTNGRTEILVWDALRTFETQRALFDREVALIRRQHPDLDDKAVEGLVSQYVRPPRTDLPPPHTTGGAVDITLLRDGVEDSLGQFDDFGSTGRADYYDSHIPASPQEDRQHEGRRLLREAMTEVGFVGIPEEFWHFEYGTRTWAEHTGQSVIFDQIVEPPRVDAIAEGMALFPPRQIVDVRGAAQVFSSVEARASALSGATSGFYYARTRHHNEREVAQHLCHLVPAEDAILLPSGLNAAVATVAGLMPNGGKLLIDRATYYETVASLRQIAKENAWEMLTVDFTDHRLIDLAFRKRINVVFCDHPRNWLLSTADLKFLRARTIECGTRLVVDTSVQPLQQLIAQELADFVTLSLSKYPTLGETMAGAVMGSRADLEAIRTWTRARGIILSPEAATTVLQHLPSLPDRISAISAKAKSVTEFLRTQPYVEEVRLPDLGHVGALCGGQLCCRFTSLQVARAVEAAVGWNAGLGRKFPLALACTFGASFTTFEHFGSRCSVKDNPILGSDIIGPEWVRIGIGLEPLADIIAALRFVIMSTQHNMMAA